MYCILSILPAGDATSACVSNVKWKRWTGVSITCDTGLLHMEVKPKVKSWLELKIVIGKCDDNIHVRYSKKNNI